MQHPSKMTYRTPRWFLLLLATLFIVAAAATSAPALSSGSGTGWAIAASVDHCQGDSCGMTQACATACAWALPEERGLIFEAASAGCGLALNLPIPRGHMGTPEPYPPPASSA